MSIGQELFIGIAEMDTHILHQMDDEMLYHICQVNHYAYELCKNDFRLRKRIKNYISVKPKYWFETIEEQLLYDMDDDLFYEIIRTNRNLRDIAMKNSILKQRYYNY